MKLGFIVPQIGPATSPEAIVQVAKHVEKLGYDSVWVTDRLLYPIKSQTQYAGIPGLAIPESYKVAFDPLQALAVVAANTSRVRLGTSVLVIGYYNPVLLARTLTGLDQISGGRVNVGMGQGWLKDEFDAVGVQMSERATLADEFVQVLKAVWTNDEVEFNGKHFQVPRAVIRPKPTQRPHPPIYLAGRAPGAIQRAATHADGWAPIDVPAADQWEQVKQMVRDAGRDPDEFKLVARANFNLTDELPDDKRRPFHGSPEQIRGDIAAARTVGVDELIFSIVASPADGDVGNFIRLSQIVLDLAS